MRERYLRHIHQDYISNVIKRLVNANEKSIKIMNGIFRLRKKTCNLRYLHSSESQNPRTKRCFLDCIAYRASQIWHTVSIEIRDSVSLKFFKHEIKAWCFNPRPWYCCKPYIYHSGIAFIL